jgi:putative FmdB family regulatory protein
MPIYEYRCPKCGKRFSELVKISSQSRPTCPKCGEPNVDRIMSTFAYHKSVKDIHEESGEPAALANPDFYNDPRNIGRWTEKRFKEMGMEVPAELEQEIAAAREGELPEELKD